MTERGDLSRDLTWYQDRWAELMDVLSTSDPDAVTDRVRELQLSMLDEEAEALESMGLTDAEEAKAVLRRTFDRLQTLRRENQVLEQVQDAVGADTPDEVLDSIENLQKRAEEGETLSILANAGFEAPEHALQAIESIEQQLDELYGEKEATEAAPSDADLPRDGDTFEQLQALLAREEKLQRKLGVSSPDAVLEMVDGLTDQLDALYDERKHLAELNLNGTDDAVEMVKNMQHQLETLHEHQAQLSAKGIDGIDNALSMIDSMEAQLRALYDERHLLAEEEGTSGSNKAASQLAALEAKLASLSEEKESLRAKRNQLQNQLNELKDEVDLTDPRAISSLIDSLESQLEEGYGARDASSTKPSTEDQPLLPDEALSDLEDMNPTSLNSLPVGVFCVDGRGIVRRANQAALQWPDAEDETPDALIGSHFFDEVAPSTNNALFRGRFEEGIGKKAMDEQFHYTYVSTHTSPTNLTVRFHSKPSHSVNWILFRVLERY